LPPSLGDRRVRRRLGRSSVYPINRGTKGLEFVKNCSAFARRSLNLSRVVELSVRPGVHHLVACHGIRSLDSSGYVDCSRDWKDSYPVVLTVKDRANNPYHLVSERHVDHREGVRPVEDRSAGS